VNLVGAGRKGGGESKVIDYHYFSVFLIVWKNKK